MATQGDDPRQPAGPLTGDRTAGTAPATGATGVTGAGGGAYERGAYGDDGGRFGGRAGLAVVAIVAAIIIGVIVWAWIADENQVLVVNASQAAQQGQAQGGQGQGGQIGQGQVGQGQFGTVFTGLDEGDGVRVIGTVRLFRFNDFVGDGGFGDNDQGLFGDFEGQPVIVAEQVIPLGDQANIDQVFQQVTLEDISDLDPGDALIGQRVAVTGSVEELVGLSAFVMEGD